MNAYEPQENVRGRLKWKFKTKGDVESSPAVAQDGTIYVGSLDHYLYAINPNGSEVEVQNRELLAYPQIPK